MPINVTKTPSTPSPEPTFEEAMQRLEAIVDQMESGETALAELLSKFEEGSRLITQCELRLKNAELKIEQLKRQKDGSTEIEPFTHDRSGV